jgi:CRISPR/Cas system Type II protein with McrA/HNH and RuvC-like nuclease domain
MTNIYATNRRRTGQRVFDLYGANCVYCGLFIAVPGRFTIDHVQPRSKGGSNSIENLRPVCRGCNQVKANRTPTFEWAADIMRVAQRPRGRFLAAAVAVVGMLMFWR